MPRTGSSGAKQERMAEARHEHKPVQLRSDTPDWIIRSGTSSRSCRIPDWVIKGQVAAWRPLLDNPGLATSKHQNLQDFIQIIRALIKDIFL